MIDGVRVKELTVHKDIPDRDDDVGNHGFLMEVLRDDDGLLQKFGQSTFTVTYPNGKSVREDWTFFRKPNGDSLKHGVHKKFFWNGNTAESWNEAARKVYGFDSVDGLERAGLDALRTPPSRTVARGNNSGAEKASPNYTSTATAGNRSELRTSAAPSIPSGARNGFADVSSRAFSQRVLAP